MAPDLLTYEWTCPVCAKRKTGLSATDRVDVESQAANAVECHVRTTSGDGHGPAGRYPAGFDPGDANEYVDCEPDPGESGGREWRRAATR